MVTGNVYVTEEMQQNIRVMGGEKNLGSLELLNDQQGKRLGVIGNSILV